MKRSYFAPEAIQTSAMDCGPASLKTLLEGHGIRASYGRLREACQTDVDGTSIDRIEDAARQLGLRAEQTMAPLDHLLTAEADMLPALVIVRQASGQTHFVVVWRRHRGWLQVMDPAVGRRWTQAAHFLRDVYVHTQTLPAAAWREWAGGPAFLEPLRGRMRKIGPMEQALIDAALDDSGEARLARLDAAVRLVGALVERRALAQGKAAATLLQQIAAGEHPIPDEYWSVLPQEDGTVRMRGAVLLQVHGRMQRAEPGSVELAAVLAEKPSRPIRVLLKTAFAGTPVSAVMVTAGLAAAGAGTVVEALLLRGLFDMGHDLTTRAQRMGALAALATLAAFLLALDFSIARCVLRLGRTLEASLRLRFLAKIPRLADRYFQSRPISDMAARSHNVHILRRAPEQAADFLRACFGMAVTVAGIAWLYPDAVWAAALIAIVSICIPLAAQPLLAERDLRLRSHAGALSRFYLDALLGLTAIRAHGAERALRREQEVLLAEWARASLGLQRLVVAVEGIQFAAALAVAAWLLWQRLERGGEASAVLLLVYWMLNLPALGQEAASTVWQYPALRNHALRLLEPVDAPEEPVSAARSVSEGHRGGAAIVLEQATVRAGGNVVLDAVSLKIPAGGHVAIVGASGAGKSSLVGLLLGWHRTATGRVLVDGEPLDASAIASLRRQTAWIDPEVQVWNRTLFANLKYGGTEAAAVAMDEVLDAANLRPVLEKLPAGFQTMLGENGALVSGGEGQRVRMGRALARTDVRLVILDEPTRGLDRARRHMFMLRAREWWKDATLLSITHDVSDTREFDRVLVMDAGSVVEDGAPAHLAADPDSRYRKLLDAEDAVRRGLWRSARWRRITIAQGRVVEEEKRRSHVESAC